MLAVSGITSMPWDVARALSPEQAMAAHIVWGQSQGGVWDWSAMRWREPQR